MTFLTTSTTLRTLFCVSGFLMLASSLSFLTAQEAMDKAAIPRPGAARMKKEDDAREARRKSREIAIATAIAEAEGRSAETEDDAEEEAAPGLVTMDEALPPELAELLPVGSVFEGVRFPQYQKDKLTQIINAQKMSRLDSEHLDLIDLVIDILNDFGEIETKVFMDRAVYDLTEKKLVSRSPATIEQKSKFVMTGDKLIFEGNSQLSTMIGNVKFVMKLPKSSGAGGFLAGEKQGKAEVEK